MASFLDLLQQCQLQLHVLLMPQNSKIHLMIAEENYLPSTVNIQLTRLLNPNPFSHRLLLLIMPPIKTQYLGPLPRYVAITRRSTYSSLEQIAPICSFKMAEYEWLLVILLGQRILWCVVMSDWRDSFSPKQTSRVNHYIYILPPRLTGSINGGKHTFFCRVNSISSGRNLLWFKHLAHEDYIFVGMARLFFLETSRLSLSHQLHIL